MEFTGPKPADVSRQSKPIIERRRGVRHRVHSPAYATLNGTSPAKTLDLSEILDISEHGMSIQTSSPLETDHDLDMVLDLSETRARIGTAGRVVWSDSSGRAGIRFPKLSGESLRQLKEWFFVNILTAYDHARAWTRSAETDESNATGSGSLLSLDLRQNEVASRTPEFPRNGGSLAESDTIQAQMKSGNNREAALQAIADQALSLTHAAGAAIALSEGIEMICQATAGSDAPPVGTRLQVGSGFSGECVRTGRSLRCDDSETDDRVDREGCRALGIRSIVAVPIRTRKGVAGLLEVFSSHPYAFSAKDISALQNLTGSILSIIGLDTQAPAPSREIPKTSSMRTHQPGLERPFSDEVLASTMAAVKPSPHQRLQKTLLVAAVATFIFALLWLIAPWVSSRLHSSNPIGRRAKQPQTSISQVEALPADTSDLAGMQKLAEHGDPAAQFALGARYATGEEVKQDYTEAVRWFSKAADQGHIMSQATLGAYYWAGRGVPQDLTKAYFWSILAQAGGDQASKYRVAVLASRMSRSQVLAAQQQANDWLRNHQTAGNIPPSD